MPMEESFQGLFVELVLISQPTKLWSSLFQICQESQPVSSALLSGLAHGLELVGYTRQDFSNGQLIAAMAGP